VLLQLLSNSKRLTHILRGPEADLPSDLRDRASASLNWSSAEQAAARAQLLSEWNDIRAKQSCTSHTM
jgi:hypothetical protein